MSKNCPDHTSPAAACPVNNIGLRYSVGVYLRFCEADGFSPVLLAMPFLCTLTRKALQEYKPNTTPFGGRFLAPVRPVCAKTQTTSTG
jgi:hypothetical protein